MSYERSESIEVRAVITAKPKTMLSISPQTVEAGVGEEVAFEESFTR